MILHSIQSSDTLTQQHMDDAEKLSGGENFFFKILTQCSPECRVLNHT